MNTVQLTTIMDKLSCGTHFLGMLPCDHLSKRILKDLPTMVIINTDSLNMSGEHWLAVFHRSGERK